MKTLAFSILAAALTVRAQGISADQIMQRVAANQDRDQKARAAYVYHQKVLIRTLDSHGKIRGEQNSEYTALPDANGTRRELTAASGKYLKKGRYIEYQTPAEQPGEETGVDNEIAREMRDELLDGSKDGIHRKLFPLTTAEIGRYAFELKGEETWRGVRVYRIVFEPKNSGHTIDVDTGDGPWAGEALISADEFQPISIETKLAHGIPAAVRIVLGTNVRGLGFSIGYEKIDGGVWFPVSFGAEFSVRVLFAWSRTITVSLANSDFRKADVTSKIEFAEVK